MSSVIFPIESSQQLPGSKSPITGSGRRSAGIRKLTRSKVEADRGRWPYAGQLIGCRALDVEIDGPSNSADIAEHGSPCALLVLRYPRFCKRHVCGFREGPAGATALRMDPIVGGRENQLRRLIDLVSRPPHFLLPKAPECLIPGRAVLARSGHKGLPLTRAHRPQFRLSSCPLTRSCHNTSRFVARNLIV